MFAATLLFTTYSTFGPIAQDASFLYFADHGTIVRVDKNDPTQRMALTAPTDHRIAAVDIDGDRVLYGTAPMPHCTALPTFPPETVYWHSNCSMTDAETDHELRSASIFGGDERLLIKSSKGFTEIAHDDEWIYWLEPSNSLQPLSASIGRKNKATGFPDLIAHGLIVSPVNQHPFALTSDAIYVVSGTQLLRVSKSPNRTVPEVAEVDADSSIAAIDDRVYFVHEASVYELDARSGSITLLRFPILQYGGATYPISILGVAPGVAIASEGSGWTHTIFRGWILSDLCADSARLLASTEAQSFSNYFIAPLSDPAVAVDSSGVYFGDQRVVTFASKPSDCGRRRGIGH